jgi:hypothetical protein
MLLEQQNYEKSDILFVRISNGQIVASSESNDPKAVSRVNKLGKTVYERYYASIVGKITQLSIAESKFGENEIRVGLKFGDKYGILSFNADSSYGRGFYNQIFNLDLTKNIIFTPWQKVFEDGKKRTNLYLSYGRNEKVAYSLPEGTPEIKWLETKKGNVMDPASKIDHDDFLETKLKEFIESNDLTFKSSSNGEPLSTMSESEFLEMSGELTADEKKELKNAKSKKTGTDPVDSFFDDL